MNLTIAHILLHLSITMAKEVRTAECVWDSERPRSYERNLKTFLYSTLDSNISPQNTVYGIIGEKVYKGVTIDTIIANLKKHLSPIILKIFQVKPFQKMQGMFTFTTVLQLRNYLIGFNRIQLDDYSNPPTSKFNQLIPKIFEEAHYFNLIKNLLTKPAKIKAMARRNSV